MKYNLINTLEKKWNAIIRTLLLFLPLFQFVVLISSVWGVKRLPRVSIQMYLCMHQTIVYLDNKVPLCLQSVLDIAQIRLSIDKR